MFSAPNYNYNYSYPWNNYGSQAVVQPQPQPPSSGINWVQGEGGAKSYAIAPGQSVLLMDSENNVFYIKSSDTSGVPMPLRTFDYKERVTIIKKEEEAPIKTTEYITREEFEKRITEITNNAKQRVPTAKQQQQQQ